MEYKTIHYSVNNRTAVIQIDDSERLNALSPVLVAELEDAINAVINDKDLRAAIITGTGRSFISGADISFVKDLSPEEMRAYAKQVCNAHTIMQQSGKVFIAAINGFCLGGGLEFALSCDIRLASSKAKFGFPEVNLGIIPGAQGTQLCTRLIGPAKTKELILSGKIVSAQKANELGLLNDLVEPEELMDKAMEFADSMSNAAPIAQAYAKNCINACYEMNFNQGCEYESQALGLCYATEDHKEGMTAFIEKRTANFKAK